MNMFAVKNIIRYDEDLSIKNIFFFGTVVLRYTKVPLY